MQKQSAECSNQALFVVVSLIVVVFVNVPEGVVPITPSLSSITTADPPTTSTA
jgi:hypothetical protein